jgi:ketosteroid isomerase-like protein
VNPHPLMLEEARDPSRTSSSPALGAARRGPPEIGQSGGRGRDRTCGRSVVACPGCGRSRRTIIREPLRGPPTTPGTGAARNTAIGPSMCGIAWGRSWRSIQISGQTADHRPTAGTRCLTTYLSGYGLAPCGALPSGGCYGPRLTAPRIRALLVRASADEGSSAVSRKNVDVVRAIYDAFARGDVDAVFAAMEPDIEWDESEGMPYGGVYRGRDAIITNVFTPIPRRRRRFHGNARRDSSTGRKAGAGSRSTRWSRRQGRG